MSRLIVKGLPSKIKEEKVRELFEEFGKITDFNLKYSKDGVFRRFGFVGFEEEANAQKAIAKLNNTIIKSARLTVFFSLQLLGTETKKLKTATKNIGQNYFMVSMLLIRENEF